MADPAVAQEHLRREVIGAAVLRRAEELGGALPWEELAAFPLPDGTQERLVDPGRGGIWNPRGLSATLSILTSPDGPYADREVDGLLQYSYQAGPEGGKNLKLRAARELDLPLIRFHKVDKGWYAPIYPVFVVDDNPIAREFTIAVDEVLRALPASHAMTPMEKRYVERLVRQRVHQPAFRARVLLAYERSCAVCSLRHVELLDAAHIIEDVDERGLPEVTNGLSLCKIHHAAYDRLFIGISPDYVIEVNRQLLDEVDGPMLRHGLQEMHGRVLTVPLRRRDQPDRERLDARYQRFRAG